LLKGLSREKSLETLLSLDNRQVSASEFEELLRVKNEAYLNSVTHLSPQDCLPGVTELIDAAKKANLKLAVGSASRNAKLILQHIELDSVMDTVVDGHAVKKTKPDPEVFLRAAKNLQLSPAECLVFEDAEHARALFADEIDDNIYSRFSNPNVNELVEKLCLLEKMEDGFGTASGMAAVFASMAALLKSGDHILASSALFASSTRIIKDILPNWGIEYSFFDIHRPETWEAQIKPNTKMIFAETPSNPGLVLIDLEFLCGLGKKHGVLVNIDNCFATPYIQQPSVYGADIITHSATKFMDGQGRAVGGAI